MLRPRTGWSGAVLLQMPTPAGPESGALRVANHGLCNTQCLLQCLLVCVRVHVALFVTGWFSAALLEMLTPTGSEDSALTSSIDFSGRLRSLRRLVKLGIRHSEHDSRLDSPSLSLDLVRSNPSALDSCRQRGVMPASSLLRAAAAPTPAAPTPAAPTAILMGAVHLQLPVPVVGGSSPQSIDPPTDPRQSIGTTNAAGRNRRSKGLLKSE